MKEDIICELAQNIPRKLVDELFRRHGYMRKKFLEGYYNSENFEPSELNGGKFCEVVLRVLQHLVSGNSTPLDSSLRFDDNLVRQFEQAADVSDSVRIHIPRAVRTIFDVRNRRAVAHISDKIDPNLMDSTFVVSVADWILAELVCLYANRKPVEAQKIIDGIVETKIPVMWNIDGKSVILNPGMPGQSVILVFLYQKQKEGATIDELNELFFNKASKMRGFLTQLVKKKFIAKSPKSGNYVISPSGKSFVEKNIPLSVNI